MFSFCFFSLFLFFLSLRLVPPVAMATAVTYRREREPFGSGAETARARGEEQTRARLKVADKNVVFVARQELGFQGQVSRKD